MALIISVLFKKVRIVSRYMLILAYAFHMLENRPQKVKNEDCEDGYGGTVK